MRTLLLAIVIAFPITSIRVCAQDDPISKALDVAKQKYDAASTEIEEAFSKWFISQEERYRLKGDLESLKRIEASREAFTSKGLLFASALRHRIQERLLVLFLHFY